jgi:hypothetical protein
MKQTRVLPKPQEFTTYFQFSHFLVRQIEQQGMIVPYRTVGVHRGEHQEMPNQQLEAGRIVV